MTKPRRHPRDARRQPGPSTERPGGYTAAAVKVRRMPKPPASATVRRITAIPEHIARALQKS